MPLPSTGFSFRAFPSQGSRTPLEAAYSPAVIHRPARTHQPSPSPRFRRLPRLTTQSPGSPEGWRPLSTNTRSASRLPPGGGQQNRSVQPASSTSKSRSPCESVHDATGCPAPPAAALLVFGLLRAFSSRTSDPRTRRGRNRAPPLRRRLGGVMAGTSRPPLGVSLPSARGHPIELVGRTRPPSRPTAPPLDGVPSPLTCQRRAHSPPRPPEH